MRTSNNEQIKLSSFRILNVYKKFAYTNNYIIFIVYDYDYILLAEIARCL